MKKSTLLFSFSSFLIWVFLLLCNITTLAQTIPSNLSLKGCREYYIVSVYDQDYLPYTAPTGAATITTPVAADAVNEAKTLNIQGSITTTGVTVYIPVTATGSGTLAAFSTTITIPASMTEDGISRDLSLSWAAQYIPPVLKQLPLLLKR